MSTVALRVDVDFVVGLRDAVPAMLDELRRYGMRATFFVVAGSNDPRRSLMRLLRPGYLRRLRALGVGGLIRTFSTGRTGSGFLDSAAARRVVQRIVDEGHELAVHGHDHAWWADHAWESPIEHLSEQIEMAFRTFEGRLGLQGLAWGSPAWRTTADVLRRLHERGVPYFSECWGREPFVTLDEQGKAIPVAHLPITLPSLESLMLVDGLSAEPAVQALLERRRPGAIDLLCTHDYFEGLLRPGLFGLLLRSIAERGEAATTLREAAGGLDPASLPGHRLTRAGLPGFVGEVSWQQR